MIVVFIRMSHVRVKQAFDYAGKFAGKLDSTSKPATIAAY